MWLSEGLTAVFLKIQVIWDLTLCHCVCEWLLTLCSNTVPLLQGQAVQEEEPTWDK